MQYEPIVDHLWVYLLLFSTLIPTAIHFRVAVFALFFWIPTKRLDDIAKSMAAIHAQVLSQVERNHEAAQGQGQNKDDLYDALSHQSRYDESSSLGDGINLVLPPGA